MSARSDVRRCLIAAIGFWAVSAAGAMAHDFWVAPETFWPASDLPARFTLQVGHGEERQRSQMPLRRIVRFIAVAPGGAHTDLRASLTLGAADADGDAVLVEQGAHVVAMESDNAARSVLPAARFNAYLEREGLTPALDQRRRTNRMGADGVESYRRCAKAIVQVGHGTSGASVTRPVGLSLEIVPEASPYALAPGEELPVLVLYHGRPLEAALVRLTNLEDDTSQTARTDASGRARFALQPHGQWLLTVAWTQAMDASSETDFDTTFSSLAFGS
ncbi:MAG: DUF4198 domain-containing protein [Vitreimonas sp.]